MYTRLALNSQQPSPAPLSFLTLCILKFCCYSRLSTGLFVSSWQICSVVKKHCPSSLGALLLSAVLECCPSSQEHPCSLLLRNVVSPLSPRAPTFSGSTLVLCCYGMSPVLCPREHLCSLGAPVFSDAKECCSLLPLLLPSVSRGHTDFHSLPHLSCLAGRAALRNSTQRCCFTIRLTISSFELHSVENLHSWKHSLAYASNF